jgi:hypothetical protein
LNLSNRSLSDGSYKINSKNNSENSIGYYKIRTIKDSHISMPKYEIPANIITNTESILDINEIFRLEKSNNFLISKSSKIFYQFFIFNKINLDSNFSSKSCKSGKGSLKDSYEMEIDRLEKFDGNLQLDNIYFSRSNNVKENSPNKLIIVPNIDVNFNVNYYNDYSKSNSNESENFENKKSQIDLENYLLLKSSKNIRVIYYYFLFFIFYLFI